MNEWGPPVKQAYISTTPQHLPTSKIFRTSLRHRPLLSLFLSFSHTHKLSHAFPLSLSSSSTRPIPDSVTQSAISTRSPKLNSRPCSIFYAQPKLPSSTAARVFSYSSACEITPFTSSRPLLSFSSNLPFSSS